MKKTKSEPVVADDPTKPAVEVCEWKPRDHWWITECVRTWAYCIGSHSPTTFRYCPYCGKKVKIVS